MLDVETRRRIDTARDILVGKVPDPKSQVEQITIALIYKFMWDIEAQSEELGGKRSYFVGEFDRYAWPKLMHAGLGGHETLNLYAEALTQIPRNPGVPPLFRGIFDNAYLPYRDPETLREFLKVIDRFEYDHSERLGDAFEYLLSIMGAQGDAGQFRTPRHIIDFIVDVVDPRLYESVLDPACGTAGFLISAYKHIRRANTDADDQSTLTPHERGRLAESFSGYDISPDMVRLSRVNMYLHGFTSPDIHEYDTLTSEERWNERADVILANPPFMSPKGGIRPHSRFTVQSRRSEVLFVDYMAEHLTPSGRAGIIVPEGIIFQSQKAHTRLRQMLVEDYLVAVVSLPAGVFQPYSGVKTSILILNPDLARRSDRIAFVKVEHDGFDLGAQRRPIDRNDLPRTARALQEFLNMDGRDVQDADKETRPTLSSLLDDGTALIVKKERIAESGDYNLSAERYRMGPVRSNAYPLVRIGDASIFRVDSGGTPKSGVEEYWNGGIAWATLVDLPATDFITEIRSTQRTISERGLRESSAKLIPENSVVVSTRATIGRIAINRIPMATNQGFKNVVVEDPSRAVSEYVALALTKLVPTMEAWASGGTFKEISKSRFCELQIPLPPLDVQREIVAEIEGYQKVIDGAQDVIDNYRPHIPIDPTWPTVNVKDACTINPRRSELADIDKETVVSFVPMADMTEHQMNFKPKESKHLKDVGPSYTYFRDNDVLVARVTPCFENGKAGLARGLCNGIGFGSSEFYVMRPTRAVLPEWVFLCIATPEFRSYAIPQMTGTGGLQRVPRSTLENYRIPLPDLATQQQIITEVQCEQSLVDANRDLIRRIENKVGAAIGQLWSENEGS